MKEGDYFRNPDFCVQGVFMPGKERMSLYRSGPWLIFLSVLLWASDAPFRKFLTQDLSSTTIVFLEHIFISILVLPFLIGKWHELKKLTLKEWGAVLFIAWGGSALATVLFTQAFHYVSPTVAILLQKVQPFFAISLAALILRERITVRFWPWAILGIFGAYLVTFPGLTVGSLTLSGGTLGAVLALVAAFFWGGSTVFGRLVLQKVSFQTMTALRFLGALIFLAGLQAYYGRFPEIGIASAKDWGYVFIVAVVAGYFSLLIYYRGLKVTKASIATIAELGFPVAATVVNWIFLDATLNATQIAGGLILLFAVWRLSAVNAMELATRKATDHLIG